MDIVILEYSQLLDNMRRETSLIIIIARLKAVFLSFLLINVDLHYSEDGSSLI